MTAIPWNPTQPETTPVKILGNYLSEPRATVSADETQPAFATACTAGPEATAVPAVLRTVGTQRVVPRVLGSFHFRDILHFL